MPQNNHYIYNYSKCGIFRAWCTYYDTLLAQEVSLVGKGLHGIILESKAVN